MVDELLKSAKVQISERIASPLIGSFSLSWCLWNYKFLVILFSDASVSQTFHLIDSVAFPTAWSLVTNGVLLPALTAAIYIFAYPYPAKFVYEFTRLRQKEVNEVRQRIEDETLLTIEESRKIWSATSQVKKKLQETVDQLNMEVAKLKDELDIAHAKPTKESTSVNVPAIQPLPSTQLALLQLLEARGGKEHEDNLVAASKQSKVKAEFDLGELRRLNLVEKDYDRENGGYYYKFTHEGRRALLESNKQE